MGSTFYAGGPPGSSGQHRTGAFLPRVYSCLVMTVCPPRDRSPTPNDAFPSNDRTGRLLRAFPSLPCLAKAVGHFDEPVPPRHRRDHLPDRGGHSDPPPRPERSRRRRLVAAWRDRSTSAYIPRRSLRAPAQSHTWQRPWHAYSPGGGQRSGSTTLSSWALSKLDGAPTQRYVVRNDRAGGLADYSLSPRGWTSVEPTSAAIVASFSTRTALGRRPFGLLAGTLQQGGLTAWIIYDPRACSRQFVVRECRPRESRPSPDGSLAAAFSVAPRPSQRYESSLCLTAPSS